MKFEIHTIEQILAIGRSRLSLWHKWFAWLPVRISDDVKTVVWLQSVLRRCVYSGSLHLRTEYKLIEKE